MSCNMLEHGVYMKKKTLENTKEAIKNGKSKGNWQQRIHKTQNKNKENITKHNKYTIQYVLGIIKHRYITCLVYGRTLSK